MYILSRNKERDIAYATPIDITLPEVDDGRTIPVFARWFGSWRVSIQRRALSAKELARAYDQEAAGWDRTIHRLGFTDAYETILRQALQEDDLKAGDRPLRVLDAGIGTGGLSAALAKARSLPFALAGIDLSPRMLCEADRHLRDAGLSADLHLGDVQDLPFEDGAFDLVMVAHVLEHLADPHRALAEMVRVLKPGGMLLACLTRRSSLGMYIHLKWRTHRVTADGVGRWFAQHGLTRIRCLTFDGHTRCRNLSLACIGRKPLT